jgi:hypothetical protein
MSEAHRFPPPSQEEQDRLFKQYGTISLTVLNPSATGGRGRMWAMICGPKSEPDGERWIVQLGDGRAWSYSSLGAAVSYVLAVLPFPRLQ